MVDQTALSARERQVLDVVYARGEASVRDVMDGLADDLSRSAVRTFLRILEEKGHLRHIEQEGRYIYRPTQPRRTAGRSAVRRVLQTFFSGSLEQAVAVHLADPKSQVSEEELARLEQLIAEARKRGGGS